MDIHSLCPMRAWAFPWQTREGGHALTIVVKATFLLVPGECTLAPDQDEPNAEENHWNDDASRSVVFPSDKVPYKPRADVLLVGHAYAEKNKPARSVTSRIIVGEVDKSIEVFCDRKVRFQDGQLIEGPRFTKLPLRWERAVGGSDTNNPVGMRFDALPDTYGMIPIANLQPPGTFFTKRGDMFASIGYGPIGANWPGRTIWLGHHATGFSPADWNAKPLPEVFDPRYFQSAPQDQQVTDIRADERIVLEYLHADHPRLVTRLPGLKPRVVANRATGEYEFVQLAADTLLFDTDRGVCVVVWRGRIGLRHSREPGRISVTLDDAAQVEMGAKLPHVVVDDDAVGRTCALTVEVSKANAAVMPFAGNGAGPRIPPTRESKSAQVNSALPFGSGRAVGYAAETPMPEPGGSTFAAPLVAKTPTLDTPPRTPPPPPPLPRSISSEPVAPPPIVTKPPVLDPIAPPPAQSPWVPTEIALGGRANPMSIGQLLTSAKEGSSQFNPESQVPFGPNGSVATDAPEKPFPAKDAAIGGAAAASNAAADEAARAGRNAWTGRIAIDLIWVNTNSLARIRKQSVWKDVLANVKSRPDDDDVDDDLPPGRRLPPKDRRDILAIMSKAEPLDIQGIEHALRNALDGDGGFTPPLVLGEGELAMCYDELETVKATLAALAPHSGMDKRVDDAVIKVQEMFKMPWSQGANGVLEETAANLRKLYGELRKGIASDRFDQQVEQTLLDGRHYRKRTVFGQPRLVGVLSSRDGKQSVPMYLPDHLAKELPSLRRMYVRVIGDVRPRAEEGEKSAAAVRVVAMGRGI